MTTLFANPGMTLATTTVILLELLSIAALCIGLLSYRVILLSHREFHSSLHHEGKRVRWAFGLLAWLYIVSTIFLTVSTSMIFIVRPRFF